MIIASCVLLMRQHGLMDAKALVAKDASVLLPTAKIVAQIEAEEAAARAAEEEEARLAEEQAAREAEEEAAAREAERKRQPAYAYSSMPAPPRATKSAAGSKAAATEALGAVRRSPLMLDLSAGAGVPADKIAKLAAMVRALCASCASCARARARPRAVLLVAGAAG